MQLEILKGYPLASQVWFQTGGSADYFFRPKDVEELQQFLKSCPRDMPLFCLGAGSNVLIRDGGVEGTVIKLGREFRYFSNEDNLFKVGAGCLNRTVVLECLDQGLSGLEFLIGIPGTIGGAVAMNAGSHGDETKDLLEYAEILTRDGRVIKMTPVELEMDYRSCKLPKDSFVIGACFKLKQKNPALIQAKIQECLNYRNEAQPSKGRTGGSTFKNPPGDYAWRLIDAVGLRGHRIGGAEFAEKHCNFILNTDHATSRDIEDLGELAREKVLQEFGVSLEWEIQRIGHF